MNRRILPIVGLAITTVGRPELARLLESVASASLPPSVVAIANQSGRSLPTSMVELPFQLRVVSSSGGVSRGRNDAVAALGQDVDVIGFPNDDSTYPATCFEQVVDAFITVPEADAIAGSLIEEGTPRFVLPSTGRLDKLTVWRAIEPAIFVKRSALEVVGGFREDLGTGCATPWQSGDGTDLLLRILGGGGVVESQPDVAVIGTGERRNLDVRALVDKHRRYARGTGYVYRLHAYPFWIRGRILLSPWLRLRQHDPALVLSLRLALARSIGRAEGLMGWVLPRIGRHGRPLS